MVYEQLVLHLQALNIRIEQVSGKILAGKYDAVERVSVAYRDRTVAPAGPLPVAGFDSFNDRLLKCSGIAIGCKIPVPVYPQAPGIGSEPDAVFIDAAPGGFECGPAFK